MHLLGYLASLLIGISLGIIGGGGSILTVPVLVYLFGVSPTMATAYSLFIVGTAITSVSALILATIVAVLVALYLVEIAPSWIAQIGRAHV